MTKSNKKIQTLAIILTLVAMGVHIYLAKHYYGLKLGILDDNSLCNLNDIFSCDTVSSSAYSSLFKVPMAIWGLITNFALFVLLLISRFNLSETEDRAQRYPLYLATFIALISVVMGGISLGVLKAYCIFCMANYAISFITLALLISINKTQAFKHLAKDVKELFQTNKGSLGIFASIPALAFLANSMALQSYGMGDIEKLAKEKVAYWQISPQQNFDLTKGLTQRKGSGEPKMVIVEFADFKCPHCKHAYPTLHSFTKTHPDVLLVFKPFPLDGSCNPGITAGDGSRCKMAYATMCAESLGQKGWPMHDHIFDQQEELASIAAVDAPLEEYAVKLGLPLDAFKACMSSPETQKLIQSMAEEGIKALIRGTPSVFVNGRLLDGGQVLPVLNSAYQSLQTP